MYFTVEAIDLCPRTSLTSRMSLVLKYSVDACQCLSDLKLMDSRRGFWIFFAIFLRWSTKCLRNVRSELSRGTFGVAEDVGPFLWEGVDHADEFIGDF